MTAKISSGKGRQAADDDCPLTLPKFTVAVDDREKKILPFPPGVPMRITHLPYGDYSLVGYERRIAIERKSLADLVQTLWAKSQLADGSWQQNSKRFAFELQRMRDAKDDGGNPIQVRRYVVVEGREEALERHFVYRRHTVERFGKKQVADFPKTMSFISSLEMRYGISFLFARDADDAAAKVYSSLWHYWRFVNGMSRDPVGDYRPPHADGDKKEDGG